MAYKYERLDAKSQQIRLLSLLPGRGEDVISCRLETVSLEDQPTYETLSYAWGDPGTTRSVLVNQRSMYVTTNLESALRHLRHEDRILVLWVDAICIQQHSDSEKSHQVSMMTSIYKNCSGVYVWLGEQEASIAGDPFLFIQHLADDKHFHDLPGCDYNLETQEYWFCPDENMHHIWDSFYSLVRSSWWKRIRCLQEGINPPCATVVYGKYRLGWKTIGVACQHYLQHVWKCCVLSFIYLPLEWIKICGNFFGIIEVIELNRQKLTDHQCHTLHWLAFIYRTREASDPRDKIIGLLGLSSPRICSILVPDYRKGTRQIYVSAFRAMIDEKPGQLECLAGSQFNSSAWNLPSWVPNFAQAINADAFMYEESRYHQRFLYSTTKGKLPLVQHDDIRLRLKGCRAGVIGCMSDVWDLSYSRAVPGLLKQLTSLAAAINPQSVAGPTRREQVWRTAIADVVCPEIGGRPSPYDYNFDTYADSELSGSDFEGWLRESEVDEGVELRVFQSLQSAVFERVMFITEAGDLGLCPLEAAINDEVWLIYGSKVPFVLRPSGDGTHKIIGDCYLDGVMHGEMMERTDLDEKIVILV